MLHPITSFYIILHHSNATINHSPKMQLLPLWLCPADTEEHAHSWWSLSDAGQPINTQRATKKGLETMAEASESRERSILKPFPDKHGCRPGISDFYWDKLVPDWRCWVNFARLSRRRPRCPGLGRWTPRSSSHFKHQWTFASAYLMDIDGFFDVYINMYVCMYMHIYKYIYIYIKGQHMVKLCMSSIRYAVHV